MKQRIGLLGFLVIVTAVLSVMISSCQRYAGPAGESQNYEVWALDQSDTDPTGGGIIYIWNGADLAKRADRATPEIVELSEAARMARCKVAKRPHMALANYSKPTSHVVISNVGSGDILFVDVASRKIVGCVSVVGGGGIGTNATHAANATTDNKMVVVADMAANALHKIRTNYATNDYRLVETLAMRDYSKQLGTPEAKPICHEFTEDNRFIYVTMAQGGLLVVAAGSPDGRKVMRVVKVYPKSKVPGIGCGAFRMGGGKMLTNGESGAKGGDDFLFIFDTRGAASGKFPDPVQIELPGEDTHGIVLCTDRKGNDYAVTAMRVSNEINFVDLQAQKVVNTQSMARPFSPDPKPDVADRVGDKIFIALRGPKPLTAIGALESPDRTPGVAVLTLSPDCRSVSWGEGDLASMKDPHRSVTLKGGGSASMADPHGLEVVWR